MEAQVLVSLGKKAGLAGIAMGVLLLCFEDILKKDFLPPLGLDKQEAFAVIISLLILAFGGAVIGLITSLAGNIVSPKRPMPTGILVTIGSLAVCVLISVIFVCILSIHNKAPDVSPSNIAVPGDSPPAPPSPVANSVTGIWNLIISCPSGSSLNESNANFGQGLYTRFFDALGVSGTTKLTMGYSSSNEIRVQGYVYFKGVGTYSVDASAIHDSGSLYSGNGKFGSEDNCTFKARSLN